MRSDVVIAPPPSKKITVTEDATGLIMELKPGMRWYVRIFLLIWFLGWTVGGLNSLVNFLSDGFLYTKNNQAMTPEISVLFICVWFAAWVYALALHLWFFFGRERLELKRTSFSKSILTPIFNRTWTYDITRIRDSFRLVENSKNSAPKLPYIQKGNVEFNHDGSKISFGTGLFRQEAEYVANRLTIKLQQLRNPT